MFSACIHPISLNVFIQLEVGEGGLLLLSGFFFAGCLQVITGMDPKVGKM